MKDLMTLTVVGLNSFAREITFKGKQYKVLSAGIGDAYEENERLADLLKKLIFDENIDVEILNKIGFADEDAGNLGMTIEGLTTTTTKG